jgi:hypothetical protein
MAIPFLQHLDLKSSAELRNALLHKTTSGAASDVEAGIIFDTGSSTVKYYNGSAWISLTANTDNYVDGASLSGTDLILTRTGSLSDLTIDLSSLDELVNDATITITAGTGLVTGGNFTTNQGANETITIDHADVTRTDTASTDAPAYGGTFDAVTGVTTNAQGHVTAIDVSTVTIPASDNTDIDVNTTNLKARLAELTGDVTITGDTIIIPGDLQVTGTTTTNNVETVSTSNGVVFEGNAADDNEVTLLAQGVTADRTIVLPDADGTVALTGQLHSAVTLAGSYDYITLSGQELTLNQIDYTTDIANTPTLPTNADSTYANTITDSVSGTTFNHGLGEDVIVQLFDTVTKETVYADVVRDGNYLDITFAATPTNSIRVLVQKIG